MTVAFALLAAAALAGQDAPKRANPPPPPAAAGAGHVMVPAEQYAELLRLKERALARASEDFSRVAVTGQLKAREAALEIVLEGRIEAPGGGTLSLRLGEAKCHAATVERLDPAAGKRQPLEAFGLQFRDGGLHLRVDAPGAYICRLTAVAPLERGPAGNRLTLTLPVAAVKRVSLVEATLAGKLRLENPRQGELDFAPQPDGRTLAPLLRAEESLDLQWRVAEPAPTPAGMAVETVVRYRVAGNRLETRVEHRVRGRPTREWTFRLPPGDQLVAGSAAAAVEGQALPLERPRDEGGDVPRFTLRTAAAVGAATVRFRLERPLPALDAAGVAALELPLPLLEGAAAARPPVARFFVGGFGRVQFAPPAQWGPGLRRSPAAALARDPELDDLPAFEIVYENAAEARVKLERPRVEVRGVALDGELAVGLERVEFAALWRLGIEQKPIDGVRVSGGDWRDFAAALDGVPLAVEAVREPGKPVEWLIRFPEPRKRDAALRVSAWLPGGAGERVVAPPHPLDLAESAGALTVRAARGAALAGADAVRDAEPAPLAAAPDPAVPRVAFKTTGPRPELRVQVQPEARRTAARVRARVRQAGDECLVTAWLRWESFGGPLREAKLTLPFPADVQGPAFGLAARGVRLPAGEHSWTPLAPTASAEATISYRCPGAGATLATPLPQALGAETVATAVELVAPPRQAPEPGPGWRLARVELPADETPSPPASSIACDLPGAAARIEWRTLPAPALPGLMVRRLLVEDELVSGRRRGKLRARLAQRLAPQATVALPPGAVAEEVLVDGVPVGLRGGAAGLEIALPAGVAPCTLEVRYAGPMPAWRWWANFALEPPRLLGEVAVDEADWLVRAPADWALAGAAAPTWRLRGGVWGFGGVSAADAESWLRAGDAGTAWASGWAPESGGRAWRLEPLGAGARQLCATRVALAALLGAAATLAAFGALARVAQRFRAAWLAGAVALVAAAAALAPDAVGWWWLGGQWAALAAALFVGVPAALAAWRRRRRPRRANGLAGSASWHGASSTGAPVDRLASTASRGERRPGPLP